MVPPRKTISIENHPLVVQVTDDGSRTLLDPSTEVAYHSASGAVAETRHVYLRNSGAALRLQEGRATSILEVGLGTGLGMLMSVEAARLAGTALDYTAIEYRWLGVDVLRQLEMGKQLEDPQLVETFLNWRNSLGSVLDADVYDWHAGPIQNVHIHPTDVRRWITSVDRTFDAIYFDPFAPDENAELWQAGFLSQVLRLLGEEGCLVTYCVSRKIRDAFGVAGFDVERVAGPPGGKREVMIARRSS